MVNVKQLKMSKFIKYIWHLIISTSNATLEVSSLHPPWAIFQEKDINITLETYFATSPLKKISSLSLNLIFILQLTIAFPLLWTDKWASRINLILYFVGSVCKFTRFLIFFLTLQNRVQCLKVENFTITTCLLFLLQQTR